MAVELNLLNSNSLNNIGTNFERVRTALQDVIGRSGTLPNHMNADLDLNSNDLLNVNIADIEELYVNGNRVGDVGWIVGNGAPSPSTGLPGQIYLDRLSGNVYGPKTSVWGLPVTNIMGPKGDTGDLTEDALVILTQMEQLLEDAEQLATPGDGTVSFVKLDPILQSRNYEVYTTVQDMLNSTEGPRGVGSIWEAGGFRYEELAGDATDAWLIENAGGVRLSFKGGTIVTPIAFGAPAADDNSMDDTYAFERAFAYLDSVGGGTLVGDLGAVYTLRQTTPPSNVTISGCFIKQIIETDKDGAAVNKALFLLDGVRNVTITNNVMDGQRGEQNLGQTIYQDGGCFAVRMVKGVESVKIRDNIMTMFATDAILGYGYTNATDPSDGPYNIEITGNEISFCRRNGISFISGDGILIANNTVRTSGVVVDGPENGATIIVLGDGPWAAPGIDFEPESRCTIRNAVIYDNVIDGCRSGLLLYVGNQSNNSIQDVLIDNNEIKNLVVPNTGTFIALLNTSPAGKIFSGIDIRRTKLHGTGVVQMWGGDGVTLDDVLGYTNGAPDPFAFGSTYNRYLNIRSAIASLRCSDIAIGNYGLVTGQFGSIAQDLQNIVFDDTCRVNRLQSNQADMTVSGDRWFPGRELSTQRLEPLPVFEENHVYRSPILFSGYDGPRPSGSKNGLMGWVPLSASERVSAASPVGSTLNVNATDASDVGASVAVQYSVGGRWYHGVISAVSSATSYTVSPALSSAVVAGQTATVVRWREAYGIAKQPDLGSLNPGVPLSDVINTVNALLQRLRSANVLGNS